MGLRLWLETQHTQQKAAVLKLLLEDLFRSRSLKMHFLVMLFLFPDFFFFFPS